MGALETRETRYGRVRNARKNNGRVRDARQKVWPREKRETKSMRNVAEKVRLTRNHFLTLLTIAIKRTAIEGLVGRVWVRAGYLISIRFALQKCA